MSLQVRHPERLEASVDALPDLRNVPSISHSSLTHTSMPSCGDDQLNLGTARTSAQRISVSED